MAGVNYSIQISGQEQVIDAFNHLIKRANDLEPVFSDIGEYLIESTQQRFVDEETPDGEPWTPLKEKTIKYKARKDKILTESGSLADTLNYQLNGNELLFGSNLEYAATHQFGRENANIPAREFLGLSNDDEKEILGLISDHLLK